MANKAKKTGKKTVKKTAKKAPPKPVRKATIQKTTPVAVKKVLPAKATGKAVKKAKPEAAPQIPMAKPSPLQSAPRGLLRGEAPAPEKTALDTLYVVNESTNAVTLEINVGAKGQTSDMTIMLDDVTIAKELAGDFAAKSLGTNKALNGKKLSIVATIADTSKETNLTSLTIHLKGGVAANDFPLAKTVDAEGDSEDYLCTIEFFNPLL